MSSSNAMREAKKRERAHAQIDENVSAPTEETKVLGEDALLVHLYPMDSYSTKFMTQQDQMVLAVDKIDAPEVKAGMMPQDPITSRYMDPHAQIYDYVTRFSLNDGDPDAYKTLMSKLSTYPLRKYQFRELSENSDVTLDDFAIVYMRNIGRDGLAFVFDMYDGGELSGNAGAPSASVFVEIMKDYTQDPVKLKWEYVVSMHVDDNKKPKDVQIKSEYLKLQSFMRAIIVTMGILPSNLK